MKRAITCTALLAVLLISAGCGETAEQTAGIVEPLPSWNDGLAKERILDFVTAVSDPGSKDFVAPEARVAVFDNDGTLWAEQPLYFQLFFTIDRVKQLAAQHPEWKSTQPFQAILENDMESLGKFSMEDLVTLLGATHGGVTSGEFRQTVKDWIEVARHPRFNRLYKELVYQPMLELLDHLRANNFQVYICSGGGMDFMRAFASEVYKIPPENIIGSSGKMKFEMRGGQPVLFKAPGIARINDKDGKPVGIDHHIGRRPILAFGNSDGDLQMLQYTDAGELPRLLLLLHHDDAEREYAYDRASSIGHLDKALDEAAVRNWVVVSMQKDFKRVFPFEPSQ